MLTAGLVALQLCFLSVAPAGRTSTPIAADGVVVAPEGARFRLPPKFTYSVAAPPDAPRVYAGRSSDGGTVAAVSVVQSEGEFGCDGDDAAELGLTPFETAQGYAGCRMVVQADDSPVAIAATFVNAGAAVVAVNVIAPSRRAASVAADAIAASIQLGSALAAGHSAAARTLRAPRLDRRLVGCFEASSSVRPAGPPYAGSFTGETRLCLAEDFTFTRVDTRGAVFPGGASVVRDEESAGRWLYADRKLSLLGDDGAAGASFDVAFDDDGLVFDGRRWARAE